MHRTLDRPKQRFNVAAIVSCLYVCLRVFFNLFESFHLKAHCVDFSCHLRQMLCWSGVVRNGIVKKHFLQRDGQDYGRS